MPYRNPRAGMDRAAHRLIARGKIERAAREKAEANPCATAHPEPRPFIGLGGRTRYSFSCTACGVTCSGWTPEAAHDEFEKHRTIPAPPVGVLAKPLTAKIVQRYPDYYITGRGRQIASVTDCGHGYRLTDSCPCCP